MNSHSKPNDSVFRRAPKPDKKPCDDKYPQENLPTRNQISGNKNKITKKKSPVYLKNNNQSTKNFAFTAELRLTLEQRKTLDEIFLAPEFAMFMLLEKKPKISNLQEAHLFLLAHKREFDQYLPSINRSELIDLLAHFLIEWSTSLPRYIVLDFGITQSTEHSGILKFKVPGLGYVNIKKNTASSPPPSPLTSFRCKIGKNEETYSFQTVITETLNHTPSVESKNKFHSNTTGQSGNVSNNYQSFESRRQLKSRKVSPAMNRCPLCGVMVESGSMLSHKNQLHGEAIYGLPSIDTHHSRSSWVQVFQGGAPGLGKGKS